MTESTPESTTSSGTTTSETMTSTGSTSETPKENKDQKSTPASISLAATINTLIAKSPIALKSTKIDNRAPQGVFINNPWKSINRSGIGPYVGEDVPLNTLGASATATAAYLGWGLDRLRQKTFFGQCDGFACVTTSLLVGQGSPVEIGLRAEVLALQITPVSGHAFVVVNRSTGGSVADPSTWGDDSVIVDQWYALQAGSTPAAFPRFGQAGAGFVDWMTVSKGKLRSVATFVTGTYPTVKLPPIYKS